MNINCHSGCRSILKQGAVPSVFPFKQASSPLTKSRADRAKHRNRDTNIGQVINDIENEVVIETETVPEEADSVVLENTHDKGIQCSLLTDKHFYFTAKRFEQDSGSIKYYTGFENYRHFYFFFCILGEVTSHLIGLPPKLNMSPVDQLFLTMIKLRQGKDDVEVGILFGIRRDQVSEVFNVWIIFLYFQLKEINIWPSKDVIDQHMPSGFKKLFPTTRVILDATEFPIQKPSDVNHQSATFSTYKNKNTFKCLIGCSPRGAVTFVSDAYGGSTSDRQIFERSVLCTDSTRFESKDSIMADRGIMVQDLMAPKNVFVNTPTMLKGKSQFEPATVVKDRRVASKRINIERVIGLAKTYTILKKDFSAQKLPQANRIIQVCFMLVNFRKSIVKKDA